MSLKFRGEFQDLVVTLKPLFPENNWQKLSQNHFQQRHKSGAIINWFPSTGTITLQGKFKAAQALTPKVQSLLEGNLEPEEDIELDNEVPEEPLSRFSDNLLGHKYSDTELIIGLVSPVGTECKIVIDYLKERLQRHSYDIREIRVSSDVIEQLQSEGIEAKSEFERIMAYMDLGNQIREDAKDNSILALGVSSEILKNRAADEKGDVLPLKKVAFIVNSLKHPAEVDRLREIYPNGFYLIGIAADESRRVKYLVDDKRMSQDQAEQVIYRDSDEVEGYGQHTRDTFQLSDFFINVNYNIDRLKGDIVRILNLIFGNPYMTPTFDEFAMFMAFSSALRSADLSRQVGSVVAKENEIIATGANDCPRAGGGLYWPVLKEDESRISDEEDGRDYKRGEDSNKIEQKKIVENILSHLDETVDKEAVEKALIKSKIKDITEYGRVVHAEMEALLFCARNNISTKGATLYCTTFPCHNCAKHIIAAGISRVVYVEPYPKSKAFEFYSDCITSNVNAEREVKFIPFVGVGPRKFFDLFSVNLSIGRPIIRKDSSGLTVEWGPESSVARIQMIPCSYMEKEIVATELFNQYRTENDDN